MISNKKEFSDHPADDEWKWKGLTKAQWIFVAALVLGITLMIVSGLIVHHAICKQDSSKTTPEASSVTNTNPRDGRNPIQRSALTNDCPILPATNCPDNRPLCQAQPCQVPAAQLCPAVNSNCPTPTQCTANFCTCPPAATLPPNITLTEREMTSTKTLDLINRHPAESYGRLQTAIEFMKWFEEYHRIYTRRNCDGDHRRICVMCANRYDYFRCIFRNTFTSQGASFNHMLTAIPQTLAKDINDRQHARTLRQKDDYDPSLYNNMQGALALNYQGGSCVACRGEDAGRHLECVQDGRYPYPEWIPVV